MKERMVAKEKEQKQLRNYTTLKVLWSDLNAKNAYVSALALVNYISYMNIIYSYLKLHS